MNDTRKTKAQLRAELAELRARVAKLEEARPEAQQLFRQIFLSSPVAVALSRLPEGRFVEVNESFLKMTGYTLEEVVGRTSVELGIIPDAGWREKNRAALQQDHPLPNLEVEVTTKSGEIRNGLVSVSVVSIQGEQFGLSSFLDLTERKQAEAALQAGEAQLRVLFDVLPVGVTVLDKDRRVVDMNRRVEEILDLTPESLQRATSSAASGVTARRYLRSDGAPMPPAEFATMRAHAEQRPVYGVEIGVVKEDGNLIWTRVSAAPLPEGGVVAVTVDITKHKQMEEALRKSEELFSKAFHSNPAGVMITREADGRFLRVNESFLQMLEYSREEVIGQTGVELNLFSAERRGHILQQIREQGTLPNLDLQFQTKTGKRLSVLYSLEQIELNGEACLLASVIDLTERNRAKAALQQSEERYRVISSLTSDYAFEFRVNADGSHTREWTTEAFERLTGYAPSDPIVEKGLDALIHPEDAHILAARMERFNVGQKDFSEFRILHRDGSVRWVSGYGHPILEEATGRVVRIYGATQDITERKQAEAAFRESEARMQGIVASAMDGIVTVDDDQRITLFNRAAETMFGCAAAEVMGQTLDRFLPPPARALHGEHIKKFDETGATTRAMGALMPLTALRANGEVFPIEASISKIAVGGQNFFTAILRDITERKQAEAALQESELRYRQIFEGVADAILVFNMQTWAFVDCNAIALKRLGYTREEFLQLQVTDLIHSDFHAASLGNRVRLAAGETLILEEAHRRKDGSWLPVEVNLRHIEYHGEPTILSVVRDLTARKQAEEAFRHQHAELRTLNTVATSISQARDLGQIARAIVDIIVDVMGASGGWIQLAEDGPAARPLRLVAHRGLRPEAARALEAMAFDLHNSAQLDQQLLKFREHWPPAEREALTASGVVIFAHEKALGLLGLARRGAPKLKPEERRLLVTIGHQLSVAIENIRLTEQAAEIEVLRELDRLRAELIANVSHELRTPLGLITIGVTSLLRTDAQFEPAIQQEFLLNIAEEAARLERIVDNLMDVSRLQGGRLRLETEPLDLALLARHMVARMQPQLAGHTVRLDLPAAGLRVVGDPRRLEQVLRNLLSNAVKYSEPGTEIVIQSRSTELEHTLQVRDQGFGLRPEELAQVFERFYRVRNKQTFGIEGVGLGLAICRGILEAHGGRLWAESEPGQGSLFAFALPVRRDAEEED